MILVTGATGFVGRRFIKLLVKKFNPKSIVCLVPNFNNDLERTGISNLKKLKVRLVYGDLVTKDGFDHLPKSFNLIFNLAANTEVLSNDHRVNDIGMKNLLDHLKFNSKTHLIHISTMVIFSGRKDTSNPINDSTIPHPTNEYSRTKWRGEMLIRDHCSTHNYKLTIIRPNTIYGKGGRQNGLFDTINKLISNNSQLSRINWPGKSSLVFVDDIARILMQVINIRHTAQNPIILMINPEELSLSEISRIIHHHRRIKYVEINLPEYFWRLLKSTRFIIYNLEFLMSKPIYNWLWRMTLIVENVIVCDSNKFKYLYPQFKFSKLSNKIDHVI